MIGEITLLLVETSGIQEYILGSNNLAQERRALPNW